ncbi:MAG: hypothetical protein IJ666_05780 [Ruminococcus sp.]|nr:hypothetical protein [Ruminococcus sp.]
MIQPFHTYFLACTLAHRLLHIVAVSVGEQGIDPHKTLIFRLTAELRLTVDSS